MTYDDTPLESQAKWDRAHESGWADTEPDYDPREGVTFDRTPPRPDDPWVAGSRAYDEAVAARADRDHLAAIHRATILNQRTA